MKKAINLKWKILIYLLIFAVSILMLIYFFQIIFLQSFYKNTKIEEIKEVSANITFNIEYIEEFETFENYLIDQSNNHDVDIRIFYTDKTTDDVVTLDLRAGVLNNYLLSKSQTQIFRYIEDTYKTGGEALFVEKISYQDIDNLYYKNFNFLLDENNSIDYYIHARNIDTENYEISILVGTDVIPVNATVNTLQDQFSIIVFLVLFFTFILAFFISKKVVLPIQRINEEAKKISNSKYSGINSEYDYLEIEELDNTLKEASEKIQIADKMKTDLIANVSHDLRTPLTMIGGYAEMMRDLPGENNEENADVIVSESKRLSVLVNDLLELSKLQDRRIKLNVEEIKVSDLLKNIYKQYNRFAKKEGFVFELDIQEDCVIKCDSKRIKQVLYNFINNSINYSKNEKFVLIKQSIVNENHCLIEVIDHGSGIDENKIKEIWDRYYKIDVEHKRTNVGSGIGLAISKEILEAHRSEYGVTSKLDEGSNFHFDLPIVDVEYQKK